MSPSDSFCPPQPTVDQAHESSGASVGATTLSSTGKGQSNGDKNADSRDSALQSYSFEEATPSSLGYGTRGAPAGEEKYGTSENEVARDRELDGEQMRAPGEGQVARSVEAKPGAVGSEGDFAQDLQKKKEQQDPLRRTENIEKTTKVNVQAVLDERSQARRQS